MPLNLMEHYLVLTDDIEQTRDFYRAVLGLEDGFRPELGFPGYWLYLKAIPLEEKLNVIPSEILYSLIE